MINNILQLFDTIEIVNHIDNFKQYEYIARVSTNEKTTTFNRGFYDDVNNYVISLGYAWTLEIEEIEYAISQNTFVHLEFNEYVDTNDLRFSLKIFKTARDIIIFNENIFFENLKSLSLKNILLIFRELQKPILIKNSFSKNSHQSNMVGYNSDVSPLESKEISLQCLFYNYSEFKFSPENFNFEEIIDPDYFSILINKLHFIYLLIYLFDVSEIRENIIYLKLKGHKTYEYEIDFSTINTDSINEYKKIYDWVYVEKNKVEDKLGIARNIIGFYIKKDDLQIDNRALPSILSANQLYIKGNLTKYLDSRTKIYEQVEQVVNKMNSSLDTFLGNFQKSVFVFISFYLSVFIAKIFSKSDFSTAIGKEATLLGIGLLCLSLIFMLFSLNILNSDLKRIKEKYTLVKSRFYDILNVEDVNKILNNDNEFNRDIIFYERRRCRYLFLWSSTIILLLCILFSTSDYINFKYL